MSKFDNWLADDPKGGDFLAVVTRDDLSDWCEGNRVPLGVGKLICDICKCSVGWGEDWAFTDFCMNQTDEYTLCIDCALETGESIVGLEG